MFSPRLSTSESTDPGSATSIAGHREGQRRRSPNRDGGADADPLQVAHSICLRLLDQRPRTRRELSTAMARKQVPEAAAAEVLDRLAEVGLIDDAAFAAAWVDSRHIGRGLGRRALAAELQRKGIDQQTAAVALASVSVDDEAAVARTMIDRKLRSMTSIDEAAKTRRLVGMLQRKGIPGGIAMQVVRQAIEADRA